MGKDEKKEQKNIEKTIDLHYKKTDVYRSFHVDGVFGGLTPAGLLYMELFLERASTPQIVKHKVALDGSLGDEVERTGKNGIIREIEAGLIMNINVAKIIRDWIDEKIREYEEATSVIKTETIQ